MVWTPDTRRDYARRTSSYASSVTDEEWKKLEPFMPAPKERGRPRKMNLREVIDAITDQGIFADLLLNFARAAYGRGFSPAYFA